MNSSKIVIKAENISHSYQQGKTKVSVLDSLDISISCNESIAIIGSSGSGKSTLLHLLSGLDSPTSGEVTLLGKKFSSTHEKTRTKMRNDHLGFVYQFHHLLPEFSAIENVMIPLFIRGITPTNAKIQAQKLLDLTGVGQRAKHKPNELSGGERQRVAIARAMVTKPNCILADEPTGNLDQSSANNIIDLLFTLQHQEETALVIVTHDEKIANKMEKTYQLIDKRLVLV